MSLSPTSRSTLTRLRERARTDHADLHAVLDAGLVCHVGLVRDGAPIVLPTGHFDAYTGEAFRTSSGAQRDFFVRHLGKR